MVIEQDQQYELVYKKPRVETDMHRSQWSNMSDASFMKKGLGKEISFTVTKAANKDKCMTVFA